MVDPETKEERGYVGIPGGFLFDLLHPEKYIGQAHEILDLYTMCQALGRIKRFCGNTDRSVAGHSLDVATLTYQLAYPKYGHNAASEIQKQAIVHDLHEAITGDISRPFKGACPEVCAIEDRVAGWLRTELGLPAELHPLVKDADTEIGMREYDLYVVNRKPYYEAGDIGERLYATLKFFGVAFVKGIEHANG